MSYVLEYVGIGLHLCSIAQTTGSALHEILIEFMSVLSRHSWTKIQGKKKPKLKSEDYEILGEGKKKTILATKWI